MKNKITAIVLAAGQGKRMNTSVQKQYLLIEDKPVLYYSLKCFEDSVIDDVVLVVGKDEIEYCKNNIVDMYNLRKVSRIIAGGKERYDSVYNGLCAIEDSDYVMIHDGARPFISDDIINRSIDAVIEYDACTVGMPVKDTIKIVDEDNFGKDTPNRKYVWQIQTPQSFKYELILDAYKKMLSTNDKDITDDTMVVERYKANKIKVIEGAYTNIKITTIEDLKIAKILLKIF